MLLVVWSLRLVLYLVTLFVHLGLMRELLDGSTLPSQDLVHNLTALLFITVAQVFDFLLLRELGLKRLYWLLPGTIGLFAVIKFSAFALGEVSLALMVNNLSALVTLLMALALVPAAPANTRSAYPVRRSTVAVYFLLQVLPLAALFNLEAIHAAGFGHMVELAFFNYSIVPAGYITYLLFLRQRALARESAHLTEQVRQQQWQAQAERDKRKEVGDLLDMLVHEVRTPLATLRMAQQVDDLSQDMVRRTIRTIDHAVRQACRVDEIERDLTIARCEPVDVAAFLAQVSRDHGVNLVVEGQAGIVKADPDLLKIVIDNLLTNALKYRRPETPIRASLQSNAAEVVLQISNEVEAEYAPDLRRLGEKYYRQPGMSAKPGTGLGLYIVKNLCDRMGLRLHLALEGNAFQASIRWPRFNAFEPASAVESG